MKRIFFLFSVLLVRSSAVKYEVEEYKRIKDAILDEYVIRNTTVEMIQMEGYPAESHFVTTADGYILNVHRIPNGKSGKKNNKVALLQHGLTMSSADWIIQGPDKSLAYVLADEGYDVWMGNSRGNVYSRNHTTLNPDNDADFWQFSWHQMGTLDLPAVIDYILDKTGVDGVYYVGHSQGTTEFYVMGSERPDYNKKIKTYVHLAPIAYMKNMFSPLCRYIALFEKHTEVLVDLIGWNEFLPSHGFVNLLTEEICEDEIGSILCENVMFALYGFDPSNLNATLLPTIFAHAPAGASTKQLLHYAQLINSGYFRQYDFGAIKNLKMYRRLTPPKYDLSKVTAPGYLLYGKNDWMAAEVDVEKLYGELGNCLGKFLEASELFCHVDFNYGISAREVIYPKVLSLFALH